MYTGYCRFCIMFMMYPIPECDFLSQTIKQMADDMISER